MIQAWCGTIIGIGSGAIGYLVSEGAFLRLRA
jgi:hypothetical protein